MREHRGAPRWKSHFPVAGARVEETDVLLFLYARRCGCACGGTTVVGWSPTVRPVSMTSIIVRLTDFHDMASIPMVSKGFL